MFKAWFEPEKRLTLKRKAQNAIENYREKTGKEPTLMLVWPEAEPELDGEFAGVEVRGMSILRQHMFYVGQHSDL